MGGHNSTENINTTVNQIIINTTISSLQKTGNKILNDQTLKINCDDINFINVKKESLYNCQKYWGDSYKNILDPDKMGDFIEKTCNKPWNCGGNNIQMSSNINADIDIKQITSSISSSSSELANDLKQSAKTTTGLFQFSDSTKNVIDSNSSTIMNAISLSSQEIKNSFTNAQTLEVDGGQLSYVSMSDVSKIVTNILQQNNTIVKAISDIKNSMEQDASSGSSGLIDNIIKISIIVGVVIVIGIISYFVIKKILDNKKAKAIAAKATEVVAGTTATGTVATTNAVVKKP
jgi:DNA-binding ferritin-like protein